MDRIDGVVLRYLANGVAATCVHFAVLWTCLNVLDLSSTGAANFIAAVVASTASFLGHRYFVFTASTRSAAAQAGGFVVLYLAAAAFHGAFLWLWSDVAGLHYVPGFAVGTMIQVVGVYIFNRRVVFA